MKGIIEKKIEKNEIIKYFSKFLALLLIELPGKKLKIYLEKIKTLDDKNKENC